MNKLQKFIFSNIKLIIIFFIILIVIIMFIKPLIVVLMPFIISLIITYLLSPFVSFFTAKKIPKLISILLTFLIIIAMLILIINLIVPVIYSNSLNIMNKLPSMIDKYKIIISELSIRYELSNIPISIKSAFNQDIKDFVNLVNDFVQEIINVFRGIVTNFFYIILIPVITFYFLKDGDYLKSKFVLLFPRFIRDDAVIIWYKINLILKRFILGELLVAIIVGIFTFLGLYLIGVNFSILLGIFAGIMDFIPYLGPFIGAIPAIFVAFAQSPFLAIKTAFIFIIIQQIESSLISPKIVGESVGLHPITLIFIILFAEKLFGIIGMFFAVPGFLIILIIFNRVMDIIIMQRENKNE